MALLSVVCSLLMVTSSPTATSLAAAGAGGIGGVILAIVGLGLTTFETTGDAENDRLDGYFDRAGPARDVHAPGRRTLGAVECARRRDRAVSRDNGARNDNA
jgi:hypothetical protein